MHKDKDSNGGLLTAGPIWDFNLAYGNADYCGGANPIGWTYPQEAEGWDDLFLMPKWWNIMVNDKLFMKVVGCRWRTHRDSFLNESFIFNYIDGQREVVGEAVGRNFDRWDFLGQNMFAEPEPVLDTYDEELSLLKVGFLKVYYGWMRT